MIQDYSLAIFANLMGITIFLLIMVYHYLMVNTPKKYARVKIS